MTAAAALVAALVLVAPPKEKQSWEATDRAEAKATFLPRSAQIEVDGQVRGKGYVNLDVSDPKRVFRIRVSAEGFEPAEAVVEAARVAHQRYALALRPAGFAWAVEMNDAPGLALAASALWQAGRADDAADYAEQSLRNGNTPLANKILGHVWRQRGDRDQAVRYYTMYLSIAEHPADADEIRAWLLQDRPGDITVPEK